MAGTQKLKLNGSGRNELLLPCQAKIESPIPSNWSPVIPADRAVGYWPSLCNPTDMEQEYEEIFKTGKRDMVQAGRIFCVMVITCIEAMQNTRSLATKLRDHILNLMPTSSCTWRIRLTARLYTTKL
jgi:hypothetical protein